MRLYDSLGPNPRMVRMFLLEKGITVPIRGVDILDGENRRGDYLKRNPGGQLPALELGDGRLIGETVAICEFLEECYPKPALIGETAEERMVVRQWQRRIELRITEHLYNGFRFAEGFERFKTRLYCRPDAASGLKAMAQDGLAWLDRLLEPGGFIAGNRLTLADLILFCALDFGKEVGQPLPAERAHVIQWFMRVSDRPSATQSLHPLSTTTGIRG